MKTEIFYAKKLYKGKVDVWSTIVEYCKRLNRKLIVDYEGQKMLIKDLDAYSYEGQSYIAQYADKYMKRGETYKLYRYIWSPVEQKKEGGSVFAFDNETHLKRMMEIRNILKLNKSI